MRKRKGLLGLIQRGLDRLLGRGTVTLKNEVRGELHEIELTRKELKEYKKESKRVEKLRKKLLKKADRNMDPDMVEAHTQTVVKFVPAKKVEVSKFTNKEAFDRRLAKLATYDSKTFFQDRAEVYRENIIEALRKVYNSEAEAVIAKVNELTADELQLLLLSHPGDFSIDYIYFDQAFGGSSGLKDLEEIIDSVKGKTLR